MANSKQLPSFWTDSVASFSDVAKESNQRLTAAFAEAVKNANRIQGEVIRFAAQRFNKDAAALAQFAGCKSPQEVLQVQSQLFAELSADYMQESERVLSLFGEMSRESFERFAADSKRPSA
jgi:hypothetical protein